MQEKQTAPFIFASDFDNTLFFHDGTGFHEPDLEAIRSWQDRGNLFGLCSGRCLQHLQEEFLPLMERAGLRPDFYICSSGAVVADSRGRLLSEHTMSRETVEESVRRCGEALVVHSSRGLFSLGKIWEPYVLLASVPEEVKLYGFTTWNQEGKRVETAGIPVDSWANDTTVDYTPAGVSKGTGLNELCRICGFDISRTAGMGDSWNDIPLLEAASYGFTFTSGPNTVKNVAAYTVGSIGEALQKVTEIERFQTERV